MPIPAPPFVPPAPQSPSGSTVDTAPLPLSPPLIWGRFALPRTFTALRHRNFRLFYAGQLISLIGSWMQKTAEGWLVVLLATPGATLAQAASGKTGDPKAEALANWYLALIAIANSLPILLGSLYGGVLADRYSKRTIIIWSQATQMVLMFGLSALIYFGHIQIWHVVLLALCVGITNIFDIPARQAFVVEMVGKPDLANAIALNSSIFNAARAFGPAAAGLLIAVLAGSSQQAALAECFFINAVSYLAVLVGLISMRGDFEPKGTSRESPLGQIKEVIAYLNEKRPMLLLVGLVAAFSIFVAPYFVLLPSLARFTLHTNAGAFGLLLSCQGGGALAAALLIATLSEYPRKGRILVASSLVYPVLLLLLALNRNYAVACVLLGLGGFATICFLATANALLQTSAPDNLRGRIMGVYSLILMGLTPVGSLWGGAVASRIGAPATIGIGACGLGLVSLFCALRYPRLGRAKQILPERL